MISLKSIIKMIATILFIFFIGLLGNFYFSIFSNTPLSFLIIDRDKVESLTLAMWQVEAAVVSISIALIAMTIGFTKDKVFGRNIMRFIFIEDKSLYHSKAELILLLLSLILVNYFFVVFENLFGVVLILFISLIGVIILTYYTLSLLMTFESVKEKIKKNIIKDFKEKLVRENKNIEGN